MDILRVHLRLNNQWDNVRAHVGLHVSQLALDGVLRPSLFMTQMVKVAVRINLGDEDAEE